MTTYKGRREIAWTYEFSRADDDACSAHKRLERIRRITASRARPSDAASSLPSTCTHSGRREVVRVAPGIPDLSRHGRVRLQQRGIAIDQVLTIIDYGTEQRSHGASRYFLDRRSRERLAVEMPSALRSFRTLDIQVVMSDEGSLITAAHRTKRIRREVQRSRRRTDD